jgi:hypothetical protein
MRSSADVLGLFSINVVSFSRNLVLRGLFASCVHVVGKGWSLRLHRVNRDSLHLLQFTCNMFSAL